MTEQLKDYLEQEGITHDDVLNEEIEDEHKEFETRKIIEENLKNGNLHPVEVTLTIKMVDFIDIGRLNSKTILFKDYNKVKEEYIENHKRIKKENIQKLKEYIEGSGVYILNLKERSKKYCPLDSCMEDIRNDIENAFKENFLFLPSTK